MNKLSVLFALALLAVALPSAKSDDPKKNTEDDQESMANGDPKDVDFMGIIEKCNETFVIQSSYLQAMKDSGSFPDESDRNPKCYLLCVLKKTGIASKEGVFDPVRTAAIFDSQKWGRPMEDVEAIATKCASNRVEPCKCERSYQFLKCLMEMEIKKSA